MHGDAGITQRAKAVEHFADGGCEEFLVRDEVVEQVTVEIERRGPQLLQAIDPRDDVLLGSFAETNVRIADDERMPAHDSISSSTRRNFSYDSVPKRQ